MPTPSRTIAAAGELDLATSAALRARLADAVEDPAGDTEAVVLDLSAVTFCDVSGVHVVVDAARRAQAAGRHFVVVPAPEHVQEIFALAGLAHLVPVAPQAATRAES